MYKSSSIARLLHAAVPTSNPVRPPWTCQHQQYRHSRQDNSLPWLGGQNHNSLKPCGIVRTLYIFHENCANRFLIVYKKSFLRVDQGCNITNAPGPGNGPRQCVEGRLGCFGRRGLQDLRVRELCLRWDMARTRLGAQFCGGARATLRGNCGETGQAGLPSTLSTCVS